MCIVITVITLKHYHMHIMITDYCNAIIAPLISLHITNTIQHYSVNFLDSAAGISIKIGSGIIESS